MNRLRLRRIARCYRRIAKAEMKLSGVGLDVAGAMRVAFTNDTVVMLNHAQRRAGVPRHARRAERRRMLKGA